MVWNRKGHVQQSVVNGQGCLPLPGKRTVSFGCNLKILLGWNVCMLQCHKEIDVTLLCFKCRRVMARVWSLVSTVLLCGVYGLVTGLSSALGSWTPKCDWQVEGNVDEKQPGQAGLCVCDYVWITSKNVTMSTVHPCGLSNDHFKCLC